MALETSAERPAPLRQISQLLDGYVGRLGAIWVEGEIAQLNRRQGMCFLTLRDLEAKMSISVKCHVSVLDSSPSPVTEGSRVVMHAKPTFYAPNGRLSLDAREIRPVGEGELLARIRAALRHQLAVQGERAVFEVDGLSVDLVRRLVKVRGAGVKLTPREYDFLRVLIQHAGKALTHAQLMSAVSTSSDPQYLRVYMRQLRLKLEADPERPRILLTETGVGYRLRAPDDEAHA